MSQAVCVASTCLYTLPTTPGHVPDETIDVLLRDLFPDLNQSTPGLLRYHVELVDRTSHDDPDVLIWIQVWETGRSVHKINAFLMQEQLTHKSHETWRCQASERTHGPGPPAQAYGLTVGLRISSQYQIAVKVPLAQPSIGYHGGLCSPSKKCLLRPSHR